MSLVRQGDVTLDERLAIYQTHIARLEEKLAAVQNALEHSRRTLAFYEIAVRAGSEAAARDPYDEGGRNTPTGEKAGVPVGRV